MLKRYYSFGGSAGEHKKTFIQKCLMFTVNFFRYFIWFLFMNDLISHHGKHQQLINLSSLYVVKGKHKLTCRYLTKTITNSNFVEESLSHGHISILFHLFPRKINLIPLFFLLFYLWLFFKVMITHFFYKNKFYKNTQAEICPKIKNSAASAESYWFLEK